MPKQGGKFVLSSAEEAQLQQLIRAQGTPQGLAQRARVVQLPGSFGSVRQMVDAIMEYLAQHNLNPKRYVWKAKGEEILAKIERAWKVALGEEKPVTII